MSDSDSIACVIPARLRSTRLSRKLLLDLNGFPVIYHTVQKALQCNVFSQIYCVTDSSEIKKTLQDLPCRVILSPEARNGTERIALCLSEIQESFIINLQGDEPLMEPSILYYFTKSVQTDLEKCWVLGYSSTKKEDIHNLARVKILLKNHKVVNFVRKIPTEWQGNFVFQMGVYGYSKKLLQEYLSLNPSEREINESHEILRWQSFDQFRLSLSEQKTLSLDTKEDWDTMQNFLY